MLSVDTVNDRICECCEPSSPCTLTQHATVRVVDAPCMLTRLLCSCQHAAPQPASGGTLSARAKFSHVQHSFALAAGLARLCGGRREKGKGLACHVLGCLRTMLAAMAVTPRLLDKPVRIAALCQLSTISDFAASLCLDRPVDAPLLRHTSCVSHAGGARAACTGHRISTASTRQVGVPGCEPFQVGRHKLAAVRSWASASSCGG